MPKITKAIIAVAGFGTRFLPATKVQPKEMLPLIDRPIVQYLVEEAVSSGVKEVILVTRPGVSLIKQHFGPKISLEEYLNNQGKKEVVKKLRKIGQMAKLSFVEQDPDLPYGTGSPLLSCRGRIKRGEFFVFMFGDDLVKAEVPATKQLIDLWRKHPLAMILGVQEVLPNQVSRYGIIKFKKGSKREVEDFVEKPPPSLTPSRFASFGRFILNQDILEILERQLKKLKSGKEFMLTEAIAHYARQKPVLAVPVKGKWLTTGDPLNWLKATVEFALEREDLGKEFKTYLRELKL